MTAYGGGPPAGGGQPYGGQPGASIYQPTPSGRGIRIFGIVCVVVGTFTFVTGLFSIWSTSQLLRRMGTPADVGLIVLGWVLPALVQLLLVIAGILLARRR